MHTSGGFESLDGWFLLDPPSGILVLSQTLSADGHVFSKFHHYKTTVIDRLPLVDKHGLSLIIARERNKGAFIYIRRCQGGD
jgi:hypothetical protein